MEESTGLTAKEKLQRLSEELDLIRQGRLKTRVISESLGPGHTSIRIAHFLDGKEIKKRWP